VYAGLFEGLARQGLAGKFTFFNISANERKATSVLLRLTQKQQFALILYQQPDGEYQHLFFKQIITAKGRRIEKNT
jgi:hypothetical protein